MKAEKRSAVRPSCGTVLRNRPPSRRQRAAGHSKKEDGRGERLSTEADFSSSSGMSSTRSRAGAAPSTSNEMMPSATLGRSERSQVAAVRKRVEGVKLIIMMRAVLYESSASPSASGRYAPLDRQDFLCGRALSDEGIAMVRVVVCDEGGLQRARRLTPIKTAVSNLTAVVFLVLSASGQKSRR